MQPDDSRKEGLAAAEDSCCTDETNTAATKLTRQNKMVRIIRLEFCVNDSLIIHR